MVPLLKKVKTFIAEHQLLETGDGIVLAVSGGPDSLCLLYLFNELAKEFKLKIIIAHLNHCLRPEGKAEAQGVYRLAKKFKLPFEVEAADVGRLKEVLGVGEEEAGRKARYALLVKTAQKYGATKIATGHHLGDQAETVLLNIIRGTSVDGLAGILPKRRYRGFTLIRPLLSITRKEIEAFLESEGLQAYTDSSNLETTYKRNQLRLKLIPHLEKHYNPAIQKNLAGLAALAGRDRKFLQKLARQQYEKLKRPYGLGLVFQVSALNRLPAALKGRVLYFAVNYFLPAGLIDRYHLEALFEATAKNKSGVKLIFPGGLTAAISHDRLLLSKAEEKLSTAVKPAVLPVPGKISLGGGRFISAALVERKDLPWPPKKYQACLDYQSLPKGSFIVRPRRPQDSFHPQGAPGAKKIKKFLIDQKVPRFKREAVPLVTINNEIIWLAGLRIAEPYKISPQTQKVLLLEYKIRAN